MKAKSVKAGDVAKALQGANIDAIYGPVVMRAADNHIVPPTGANGLNLAATDVKYLFPADSRGNACAASRNDLPGGRQLLLP